MDTYLSVSVFCLALTPLLAIAPIQNTAHRHTANSSGPLLPGYAVPQWSAYRLPAFAIAIQHKSLPLFVSMHSWALYAFMGLVCSVEKSKAASSGSGSDLCAWSWGRSTPLGWATHCFRGPHMLAAQAGCSRMLARPAACLAAPATLTVSEVLQPRRAPQSMGQPIKKPEACRT